MMREKKKDINYIVWINVSIIYIIWYNNNFFNFEND